MDFEEFVTLLGPKLSAAGMPDKFNGTNFDSVFWKVIISYFSLILNDNMHKVCCFCLSLSLHRNQVRYAFSALYEIQQTDTNHLMGIDSYKEPPILQIYIAEYISIQIHSM